MKEYGWIIDQWDRPGFPSGYNLSIGEIGPWIFLCIFYHLVVSVPRIFLCILFIGWWDWSWVIPVYIIYRLEELIPGFPSVHYLSIGGSLDFPLFIIYQLVGPWNSLYILFGIGHWILDFPPYWSPGFPSVYYLWTLLCGAQVGKKTRRWRATSTGPGQSVTSPSSQGPCMLVSG